MKLVIELGNKEDMTKAMLLLQEQLGVALGITSGAPPQSSQPKSDAAFDDMLSGGDDDLLGGGGGADDLDSLMSGVAEPPKVTVEDMKKAIRAAVDATSKEDTNAVIQKALAKLGVDALSKIPDEKKESFIAVLKAFASKNKK